MANRGVVYMRVLEKFGAFGAFVATGTEVMSMCGGGEFDGCEGRIRPFLDDTLEYVSESIMLQKIHGACAGGELNKGNIFRCNHTH